MHLYERLGFRCSGEQGGIYQAMERVPQRREDD